MLSLNPNTHYFDPEWKPKVIDETTYRADIDGAHRLCWSHPKDKSKYFSAELLDESLSWLVNRAIGRRRKQ